MIKGVIFDVDGTLIDSNRSHAESFAEAFKVFGKEVPAEELVKLIGMGSDKILEKYLTENEIDEVGKDLIKYRKELFLKKYLPDLKTFPKLRQLFEKINNDGKKLALASSASEKEIEEYKKLLNISDLLEAETSSDDAEESKPDPDIFLAAFEKMKNVEKSETLIIGDTPYDAEAALKTGIKAIGVLTGGWSRQKLIESGFENVYENIAEIFDMYDVIFT